MVWFTTRKTVGIKKFCLWIAFQNEYFLITVITCFIIADIKKQLIAECDFVRQEFLPSEGTGFCQSRNDIKALRQDCECVEFVILRLYTEATVARSPVHRTIDHRSTSIYRPTTIEAP